MVLCGVVLFLQGTASAGIVTWGNPDRHSDFRNKTALEIPMKFANPGISETSITTDIAESLHTVGCGRVNDGIAGRNLTVKRFEEFIGGFSHIEDAAGQNSVWSLIKSKTQKSGNFMQECYDLPETDTNAIWVAISGGNGVRFEDIKINTMVIPEPSTAVLVGFAGLALAGIRRLICRM